MRRPAVAAGAVAAYLALLLWLDRGVGTTGQLALGALTWIALLVALRPLSPRRRALTLGVVLVATCGEIVGSVIWGLYTYRLENLPSFVPPAHGLVYLGGLALARAVAARGRFFVRVAAAALGVWAVAGLTILPRPDLAGALCALLLGAFLVRGREPEVYAGVFVVVAALELYGTALGTWTWAATAPGTPVTQGNPPSGIAGGYVLFDIVALALAPALLGGASKLQEKIASRPAGVAADVA